MMVFADMRRDYTLHGLSESEADPDPFLQFQRWFEEQRLEKGVEPNAMIVATASADGTPSVRTVLLKALDHGFIFYTNYTGAKARDLSENPKAELLFYWAETERQVRIKGVTERVSPEMTKAYFHSRPRGSQIGSAASPQSQVVPGREALEQLFAEFEARYEGKEIPVPTTWGGYRLVPTSFEFWQGRKSRLHDRLRYVKTDDGGWKIERLAP
jgi:pyridoxamine 5'-phosphate oxidase